MLIYTLIDVVLFFFMGFGVGGAMILIAASQDKLKEENTRRFCIFLGTTSFLVLVLYEVFFRYR